MLIHDWLSRWRRRTVGNGSWSKLMSCRKKLTRPSDVRVNLYTIITGRKKHNNFIWYSKVSKLHPTTKT